MLPPRRRYPIQQAQYTSLGTLPSICWDGYRRKTRLSAHSSSLPQSPVTVKIAPPDSRIYRSPLLKQLASPAAFSPSPNSALDPCAKETVLSALKESRKRAVEAEEEEEGRNFLGSRDSKRRRHDSSESGQSAFEPLVANGAPPSLVPRPGSLKRGLLPSHCLEEASSKRSRASSLSSVNSLPVGGVPSSIRNAIASSYSSTRGLTQLWKQSGRSTSPLSSPASSRSQTPERPNKKARCLNSSSLMEGESRQCNTSTPVRTDKEMPAEKTAETPVRDRHSSPGLPSLSGSHGKHKRKIQLLATRRGEHFTLPPPPQVGYSVTSADLDAEKAAALQRFNRVLEEEEEEGETDSALSPAAQATSAPNSTLPFVGVSAKPSPLSLAAAAAGTNPLLESLKKMQDGKSSSVHAGPATPAETPQRLAPSPSLDLGSPEVAKTLPLSAAASLAPPPSSSTAQPASRACTPAATASSSELSWTPARPASAPKPSILLGILTSPLATTAAPATASSAPEVAAAPVFKPIFGRPLAQSEGGLGSSSSSSSPSAGAAPPPPGSVPSLAAPLSALPSSPFKPVFGAPPTTLAPPATAASSLFMFKQTLQPTPAPGLPTSSAAPATVSGFPTPSEATVASTGSAAATVSKSKSMFSFGPAVAASTSVPSSASATTAMSQSAPLFEIAPNSSTAPPFQFGKLPAPAGPAVSPFSQAPSCASEAAPTATTTTGFSIFGSSSSNATPAPSATTQPPLTFGPGPSAFSGGFAAASKPPPPPYPGDGSQLTLDPAVPNSQQPAPKPAAAAAAAAAGPVSFGTPFSFSGSVAQPAFGSGMQAPFGGPLGSFGAKSTAQLAFGATTPAFSFGTATTSAASGFGSNTQTTSSGGGGSTGASVFGSPAPPPFGFGAASQPPVAGSAFGLSAAAAGAVGTGAPPFSFGSGQSGAAGAAMPFGSSLAQNPLGAQRQSSAFAFSISGTPESKPAFGGAPPPTFGQSSPAPGAGTVGGTTLSFGAPITPAFGGGGPTFGPLTPTFSIGAGSKMGSRQRLQARRQHTRKK
ncbi:nuclear envelope pore membrane protein POM 121-like isoform X2 [Rhineura floridana]|nr:nuclear envelope pore membrane protein POM 121-like isoform X2 [Rhineura floridana]